MLPAPVARRPPAWLRQGDVGALAVAAALVAGCATSHPAVAAPQQGAADGAGLRASEATRWAAGDYIVWSTFGGRFVVTVTADEVRFEGGAPLRRTADGSNVRVVEAPDDCALGTLGRTREVITFEGRDLTREAEAWLCTATPDATAEADEARSYFYTRDAPPAAERCLPATFTWRHADGLHGLTTHHDCGGDLRLSTGDGYDVMLFGDGSGDWSGEGRFGSEPAHTRLVSARWTPGQPQMEIYEFDVELQGLDDDPAGDAAVEAAATECLGECETGCDDGCSHDCGALPDAEREQRPTCLEDCLGECALDCEEGCGDHLYDPDAEAGALAGAEYLGHYQLVATQSGIR